MSHSNTPPIRNRTPLTARSSSLRCVSAAEHQTAEQYSKTGRTKPRNHLPRSDLSWNTRQDFLKPSLWEAALETERRCFSNVIFESNVTLNITRSSDCFSTVPPIVNWGWLGVHCARPWDYHSLRLTRIQFHPPKVTPLTNHAKVTDQGIFYRNSDAWGWHNCHQSGVISITDQLIFQNGKKLGSVQDGTITGPKHCPAALLIQR